MAFRLHIPPDQGLVARGVSFFSPIFLNVVLRARVAPVGQGRGWASKAALKAAENAASKSVARCAHS